MDFFDHFFNLFKESAQWLILGFIVAGLIKAFLPKNFLNKHLGGNGIKTTLKAAFIGAPLPLCSCGVVPAALGIYRSGASKNATVSFLVSTPETGVDSIAVTYGLMGPFMAIARPISAILSAIFAGILVGASENKSPPTSSESSCCANKDNHSSTPKNSQSFLDKTKSGLQFSFVNMLDDIVVWLLIGLVFAALTQTFIPQSFFIQWGDSWVTYIVMALIGIPMYICATASTPIAAGFLVSGVSPGAVLIFMLLGPATNIGTLAIIKKELGTRAITAYLVGIVITSFICAFAVDLISQRYPLINLEHLTEHAQVSTYLETITAIFLTILCVLSLLRKLKKR